MDLIVRNARLSQTPEAPPVDIGVEGGRIVAIQPALQWGHVAPVFDAGRGAWSAPAWSRRTSIWTSPTSSTAARWRMDDRQIRCSVWLR